MSYYLAYCSETNQLVYLDVNPPVGLNDKYVVEHHEGTLPRLDLLNWNPSSLGFQPKHRQSFSQLEFLNKFTMSERISIREVAKTDPIVFDIQDQFNQASEIILDDPTLVQGIQYFGSVGLLTPERVAQILQG